MARAVAGLRAGISLSRAVETLIQAFRAAGIDTPQLDARVLAGHALRIDRARLVVDSERLLDAREIDAIDALAGRRIAREPVARIVGAREFWSLQLAVNAAVLVPRPDTETVVEAALDAVTANGGRQRPVRILDIGTGSGALLLALLTELPNATGIGADISDAALDVARANAARLALEARCAFVTADIARGVEGPFDLVVSNPPYIASAEIAALAPEVRDYDPRLALDGGADGLAAYRAIAADAGRLLAPGGLLVVELGIGQEDAVRLLFTQAGLAVPAPARKDLGGVARALLARPAARKSA
ncbi:MAG: peptide chain release factor N(5)-glutamine methyltransferase [Xanthobacteraceae bacterium]|uniref:peptide chain release factor N(5)-glutamine methyltransferase n=1 Tax=Pseudolabrys sp. TaxID=1960880 RepID=UPI003D0F0448